MSRKILPALAVAMLVVASAFAPIVVAESTPSPYEDKLSPTVAQMDTFIGYDVSDVTTYDGNPGFYIVYEDGKYQSVETWANGSADRDIIAHDNESNRVLIAASAPEVLGGFHFAESDTFSGLSVPTLTDGLQTRSYIVSIDAVQTVSSPEPIDQLDSAESFEKPRFSSFANGDGEFTSDGVAYSEDTTEATMADVRTAINADGVTEDGTGVTIAVIDNGLNIQSNTSDPLYQDRIVAPYNAITNETGIDAPATSGDHGPWVTGAIAADPDVNTTGEDYEGIAPNATVIPIKALSDSGSGSTQDIVEGIEHASENNADIISMSLGSTTYSATIADEIEEFLEDGGTAVFIAVGNSRQQPGHLRYIASPADVPEPGVIAVAATNTSSPDTARSAYFSNVGPDSGATDLSNGVTNGEAPDVAAPGMNISVATYSESGFRENVTLSGTSMSTPIVAGVGALMLDANPQLRNESAQFAGWMGNTSAVMPHAGTTEVGNGMVDAANATALQANEQTQEDIRNDGAEARDLANEAYSGSKTVRLLLSVLGAEASE